MIVVAVVVAKVILDVESDDRDPADGYQRHGERATHDTNRAPNRTIATNVQAGGVLTTCRWIKLNHAKLTWSRALGQRLADGV